MNEMKNAWESNKIDQAEERICKLDGRLFENVQAEEKMKNDVQKQRKLMWPKEPHKGWNWWVIGTYVDIK
jgi:hypothetical protein